MTHVACSRVSGYDANDGEALAALAAWAERFDGELEHRPEIVSEGAGRGARVQRVGATIWPVLLWPVDRNCDWLAELEQIVSRFRCAAERGPSRCPFGGRVASPRPGGNRARAHPSARTSRPPKQRVAVAL